MIRNFIVMFSLCFALSMQAQRTNISPFSYFGFGEYKPTKTVEQSSMGGVGVAFQEYHRLNFVNPATLSGLRVATYSLAGQTSFISVNDQGNSQSNTTTTFEYIALGLPLGKKAGFMAGLQPLYTVGYAFENSDENSSFLNKYEGTGGVNRLFASFGVQLLKGISVGVEGAFLFGNIEKNIIESKADVALSTKFSQQLNVRGGQVKLGLHYKTFLTENLELKSGVAVKLSDKIAQSGQNTLSTFSYSDSGFEVVRDSREESVLNEELINPLSTVLGIGVGQNKKWYLGVNTEIQSALNQNYSAENFKYSDVFKFSVGGFYLPKINSISSYWDRVSYSAGLKYEKIGIELRDSSEDSNFTPVVNYGMNVGLSLPLPKQISNVNIGFEYGQRGTANNNLIKENYYNLRLGLSLNSLNWFKKRQID